tara:strand:+ start:1075 stop:1551 length:477 start_codon:yes stop_codon:yes gene_type:complete
MSELTELVTTEWEKALTSNKEVALPKLAETIIESNKEAVQRESRGLVFNAVLKLLKGIAKKTADDSGQLELFGFPSVIAIPSDDGYVYIRATAATFDKLKAGCVIRQANVDRAQIKLDLFKEAIAKVEPVMSGTEMTLMDAVAASGQALAIQGAQAQD